ncbi:hypothetical protein [Agriterribacter sp.]|mgnify:CR=1 FL=1|uniref:hypothetical protein n=1 Tax=Agriterribacter sp. TaxID=2821509 RepID=UPI002C5ADC30|nr:hypothetical protein [Agriterribacter sp.]HRP56709.1 hypothetical protein [Agriterribacter sp.]
MKSRLVCFIICLFMVACNKEEINEPEPEEHSSLVIGDIIGKWDIRYPDAPTNGDLLFGYLEFLSDSTFILTMLSPDHTTVGEFKVNDNRSIGLGENDSLLNVTVKDDSLFFDLFAGEVIDKFLAVKDPKAIPAGASKLLCREWSLNKKDGGIDIYDNHNRYSEKEIIEAKVVFSASGFYFWRFFKGDGLYSTFGRENWDWHSNIDDAIRYWDPRDEPDNNIYQTIYELTDSILIMSGYETSKKLYLTPVRN